MTTISKITPAVQIIVVREGGRITAAMTNSTPVTHFLDMVKMSRAYNTWVNYTYDLKAFFDVIPKTPESVDRRDCVEFMRDQQQRGLADATINRRLATLSSLFQELQRLDPAQFTHNPIQPRRDRGASHSRNQALYRRQPKRIPRVIPEDMLRTYFEALPSWRDRTLMLLMWISCLRISEAVAIRFDDIECSRRSIRIAQAKGNQSRTVFMDSMTFAALNRYLDEERKNLFPEVGAVFVAFKGKARGQPLTVNAVQHLLRYYARKSSLLHIHAHLFRHTGITQLVQHSMAEPALRQLVGHRRPESLLAYLHLSDAFVETEFEHAQAALSAQRQIVHPQPER